MHPRDAGCVVNSALVISAAMGIVKKHDRSMLSANGGPITLKKPWANWLFSHMGMVKRKLADAEFKHLKSQVCIEDSSPALIVNWDQTSINYVPQSNWTMAKSGSSRVEVASVKSLLCSPVPSMAIFCQYSWFAREKLTYAIRK